MSCLESYLVECSTMNQLIPIMNQRRMSTRLDNIIHPLTPYLIVVEDREDREDHVKTFVCIDDSIHPMPSIMQGFDMLFKIFIVLNVQYPSVSKNLWHYVQKKIYKTVIFMTNNEITSNILSFIELVNHQLHRVHY